MGRVGVFVCASALVLLATAAAASASQLVGANAKRISLAVNAREEALVSYTTEAGGRRHLLAWGAVNARQPSPTVPQVQLRIDNSGGWRKHRRLVWTVFRDRCRAYDGPQLVDMVAACKAPDGSYWAVQSWQRVQPMRGLPAFRPAHMRWELHLSHWTGPLAVLQVSPNWTYRGMWQGLFGRLLYGGVPVHGFKASTAERLATYSRYFYIDTFNSAWGPGWKRAAAKAAHNPNGVFCFSFVRDRPPPGYPNRELRPAGNGERHRVTVMGPGVTPDVQWEGRGLGKYAAAQDAIYNAVFDGMLGGDRVCAAER
jgi:hypothetical protein